MRIEEAHSPCFSIQNNRLSATIFLQLDFVQSKALVKRNYARHDETLLPRTRMDHLVFKRLLYVLQVRP